MSQIEAMKKPVLCGVTDEQTWQAQEGHSAWQSGNVQCFQVCATSEQSTWYTAEKINKCKIEGWEAQWVKAFSV